MAPSNTNRPMPPTSLMLRTHTLAHEIVTRDKNAVFDDEYLDLLERFVRDPSESNKQEMLAEFGWGDDGGSRPGTTAGHKGSLVGLCVARHGTEDYVFTENDLVMLKEWYAGGKKVMQVKL